MDITTHSSESHILLLWGNTAGWECKDTVHVLVVVDVAPVAHVAECMLGNEVWLRYKFIVGMIQSTTVGDSIVHVNEH